MIDNIGISRLLSNAANEYGALCLDGSPGRYYINTNVTETSKYVMFLQGGGWCSGLYHSNAPNTRIEACFDRRDTHYGSTRNDTQTKNLNHIGILQNNQTANPLFYEWIKIYVRYCDGASFTGNRLEPIHHQNNTQTLIYFRGKPILSAVFDDLWNNFGLDQATDFVFSGGSAGGLAVFLNANDIASRFNKTKVVAVPIIGYFIDSNGYYMEHKTNYSNAMKWVYHHQNISASICDDISEQCMFPQNIAMNINIPLFVLNSRYDAWQIINIAFGQEIYGSMHWDLVNEFGDNFTKILTQNYLNYAHIKNNIFAAFISSCYMHDSRQPLVWDSTIIDNYSAAEAFKQFYESINATVSDKNTRYLWIDNKTSSRYPCNTCCPQYFPLNICLNGTTVSNINGLYEFEGYVDQYPFYRRMNHLNSSLYLLHNNVSWEVYPSFVNRNLSFVSWHCDSHNILTCDLELMYSAYVWECESFPMLDDTSKPYRKRFIIVFYSFVVFGVLFCILCVVLHALKSKWWRGNKFQRMLYDKIEENEKECTINKDQETCTKQIKKKNIRNITKTLNKLKPSRKGYAEVVQMIEIEESLENVNDDKHDILI